MATPKVGGFLLREMGPLGNFREIQGVVKYYFIWPGFVRGPRKSKVFFGIPAIQQVKVPLIFHSLEPKRS